MSKENVETLKRERQAHGRSQAGAAMSDDSVEVVRRAWEAWERGDMEAVFDFYDPDIEWDMSESEVPDMGALSRTRGGAEILPRVDGTLPRLLRACRGHHAGSEGVLVRMRQGGRGKESGVDVEMPPLWQLYRLRAGRAVRVEIYRDEHRALEPPGCGSSSRVPPGTNSDCPRCPAAEQLHRRQARPRSAGVSTSPMPRARRTA